MGGGPFSSIKGMLVLNSHHFFRLSANWFVALSVLFSVFYVGPSYAVYPRGDVCRQIGYSDLQVVYRKGSPWKITGNLLNKTGRAIEFYGELYLDDYFDKHTAQASVMQTIPAWGKVYFSEYLTLVGSRGFSDSKVSWAVRRPKAEPEAEPVKYKDEPEKNYSTKRQLRNGYQFSGNGTELTDKIFLDTGMLKVKASYKGAGNFIASLLDCDGSFNGTIANEIGSSSTSMGLNIRKSGYYYINVRSSGSWRIELEMPDLEEKKSESGEAEPAYSGSGGMYNIHMKNGQVISVDNYSDNGKTISIDRFGAIVTLEKSRIKKIVKK